MDHDLDYEPPMVEALQTEDGPAVTAAANSPVYGAITLMADPPAKRGKLRRRLTRRVARDERPSD